MIQDFQLRMEREESFPGLFSHVQELVQVLTVWKKLDRFSPVAAVESAPSGRPGSSDIPAGSGGKVVKQL